MILRWSFPGQDGDAIADGYRIFVNGKQYGGDLSVHTTNAMIEVIIFVFDYLNKFEMRKNLAVF